MKRVTVLFVLIVMMVSSCIPARNLNGETVIGVGNKKCASHANPTKKFKS